MIMTDKNGEIILCKGIKMDKNYENVLSLSESDMVTLCRNNKIYNGFNYAIIQPNKIRIDAKYEDCIYANYIAYINKSFGNKWFFAWVLDVKLLNPNTTEITFQVDVWSTWYSSFNVGKAFIEREHVSDDTVGKHTIPEGLELGEYITQSENNSTVTDNLTDLGYLGSTYLVAGVSEVGLGLVVPNDDKIYSGINSGLRYLVFADGNNLDKYIMNTEENMSESNIYTVFIIPSKLVTINETDWITVPTGGDISHSFTFAYMPDSSYETTIGGIGIGKPTFLDADYTPVNKKLLTFPYCFFNVTNNVGMTKDYHYELFNGTTCGFNILGAIGVGCSIKLYPTDYAIKGTLASSGVNNKLHSIDGGKLPTCSWISDSYTNWLTANSVNIGLSAVKDITQIGLSVATGNIGGTVGGFLGIADTMSTVYEHALQPASAKGSTNQGDLIYAMRSTFNIYKMSIKKEYATSIDSYFSRFGYKVNEVKTPNLKSRSKFNFIKVGGMDELISGNIPASDLEKINEIFRKGVTIFHNYSDFGNYTISNPIVTP